MTMTTSPASPGADLPGQRGVTGSAGIIRYKDESGRATASQDRAAGLAGRLPGQRPQPAVPGQAGRLNGRGVWPGSGRQQRAQPGPEGTQRRLQALMARSWSPEAIERAAEVPATAVREALEQPGGITPRLAAAVAEVYDRLWDRDPPSATAMDRQAADAARAHADARGWAPPMAWDDDQIDLHDGKPSPDWKPGACATRRAVDLVADAEFVREHGGYRDATTAQVADRLGVTRVQLARAYSRARAYAGRDREPEPEAEAG